MDRRAVLRLFRQRAGWRRLWAAEALSLTGDWFSLVAVSVLSLGRGGEGVIALSLALAAHLVPQAVLAPVAGLLADRVDRKRVLIYASLLEGVLTLAMVLAARAESIPALQLLVLARAATSALRAPAAGAALPKLVEPDELATANAISSSTWSIAFALGMALGGLATEVSPLLALGIDAMTFFGSALLLVSLAPLPAEASKSEQGRGTVRAGLSELSSALVLGTGRDLRAAVFGKLPLALAAGSGWIALNVAALAHPELGGGSVTLGVLQALRGIGTGVGPLLALALLHRGFRKSLIEHAVIAAGLLGVVGVGLTNGGILLFAVTLLWGSGAGANWVLTTTAIQSRAPHAYLGRLLALDALLYTLAMAGSALISALLIDRGFSLGSTVLGAAAVGTVAWLLVRDRDRTHLLPGAEVT